MGTDLRQYFMVSESNHLSCDSGHKKSLLSGWRPKFPKFHGTFGRMPRLGDLAVCLSGISDHLVNAVVVRVFVN